MGRTVRILLPEDVSEKLARALRAAGNKEIGGVLMGEHVGEDVFRVKDLTVQRRGGTVTSFVRQVNAFVAPLQRFFRDTGHDYARFNYLGEWHSHPSFPTRPSNPDSETLWEIVEDPLVGARFAVLMIARMNERGQLEGSAFVYLPGRRMLEADLEREAKEHTTA